MAYYQQYHAPRGVGGIDDTLKTLIIANVIMFGAQLLTGSQWLIRWFALWPAGTPPFEVWQLVSYAFLHGGIVHLLFNMYALWLFGTSIVQVWGRDRFLTYYFVCVIGAALVQLLAAAPGVPEGQIYPTIGASGGVFGILLAFGMMFPNQTIVLLIPPIPIKAKWFVIGYGALELYLGVSGPRSGVAHFAHLGGMAFGFLLIQYWRGKLPVKPKRIMFW